MFVESQSISYSAAESLLTVHLCVCIFLMTVGAFPVLSGQPGLPASSSFSAWDVVTENVLCQGLFFLVVSYFCKIIS